MEAAQDLSPLSLLFCALLMLLPLAAVWYFRLGLVKNVLISSIRMVVQLVLMGVYLELLFKWNVGWINLLWFLAMMTAAMFSVLKNSQLNAKRLAWPVLASFALTNLFILLYFNGLVVRLDSLFDAKYIIAIGGMILGNSLRGNVVGLGDFYQSIAKEEHLYTYKLGLGASSYEALLPFAKQSFKAAIMPGIASMATMGIVSVPGMMTGQLLGGSVPMTAIKYQIAIMVAILTSTVIGIALSLIFTTRIAFDRNGMLRKDILHSNSSQNFHR